MSDRQFGSFGEIPVKSVKSQITIGDNFTNLIQKSDSDKVNLTTLSRTEFAIYFYGP